MAGKREEAGRYRIEASADRSVCRGKGATIAEAMRQIGVTQQTFYR